MYSFEANWSLLKFINPLLLPTVFLAAGFIIAVAVYRRFLHPLAKVPGPFLASVTSLWITQQYVSGRWHEVALELHSKYGPVVRITPNEVSFVDSETLKKVYSYSKAAPKVCSFHHSFRLFFFDMAGRPNGTTHGPSQGNRDHFLLKQIIKSMQDAAVKWPPLTQ